MKVVFKDDRWIKDDILNLIHIIATDDYEEKMFKDHGVYQNKNVMRIVEKFNKDFDFEEMGLGYMLDENFGNIIMQLIINENRNVEKVEDVPDIIKNMGNDEVMKSVIEGLFQDTNKEFLEEEIEVDRGNLNEVMEFVNSLDIDVKIKWNVFEFISNPDELFIKIADGLIAIMPNYIKEISKYKKEIEEINVYLKELINNEGDQIFSDIIEGVIDLNDYEEVIISSTYINSKGIMVRAKDKAYISVGFEFRETMELVRGKDKQERMLNIIRTITDPMKFKILTFTKEKAAYGKELCEHTDLSKAALSYHINQLIDMGIINFEKKGNKIYYSLKKDKIVNIVGDFLEFIK